MSSPFLPDWVLAHAERTPDAPAVDSPEARLSYRDLADRMRVLSARLASGGIRPGERVLIALPNLPATVVAVSCNVTTFARDAKILIDGGYRIDGVTPVDQFRHTPHVELVARFAR